MPPRKKRASHSEITPSTPSSATGRERPLVLVVDDLPDNREMYAEYLEYSGYEVISAADGRRAVELAQERVPDVILMDISLPEIDGLAAARLLREDPRTKDVVILVLTGHVEAHYRQRAQEAGCDMFVAKPCLPSDVATHVATFLERRRS